MKIRSHDNHFWNNETCLWEPIPLDEDGLYTVEWMNSQGCKIVSSRIEEIPQVSMEGKNIPYTIKVRKDTWEEGSNMYKPLPSMLYWTGLDGIQNGKPEGWMLIRG